MENQDKTTRDIEALEILIQQKKALLQKKKSQLQQKQKKEARAKETRRKILAGAVVLQRAQKDGDFAARLWQLLGEELTEERNRILFPEIFSEKFF